jgi:hypothetical protein
MRNRKNGTPISWNSNVEITGANTFDTLAAKKYATPTLIMAKIDNINGVEIIYSVIPKYFQSSPRKWGSIICHSRSTSPDEAMRSRDRESNYIIIIRLFVIARNRRQSNPDMIIVLLVKFIIRYSLFTIRIFQSSSHTSTPPAVYIFRTEQV